RRRHTRFSRDWSSDVCSSDLEGAMGKKGDCWDRYKVRVDEVRESVRIIRQCLEQLSGPLRRTPDFDPRALVPKKVNLKAQDYYRSEERRVGKEWRSRGSQDH